MYVKQENRQDQIERIISKEMYLKQWNLEAKCGKIIALK